MATEDEERSAAAGERQADQHRGAEPTSEGGYRFHEETRPARERETPAGD